MITKKELIEYIKFKEGIEDVNIISVIGSDKDRIYLTFVSLEMKGTIYQNWIAPIAEIVAYQINKEIKDETN